MHGKVPKRIKIINKEKNKDKNLATNRNKAQAESELPTNSPKPSTRSLEEVQVTGNQPSSRTRADEKKIDDEEKGKLQLKILLSIKHGQM